MRDSQTKVITNWEDYFPYFNPETDTRLACSHTGDLLMRKGFMERVLELRKRCDFGFIVTSAYRNELHPVEARKKSPGAHSKGIAIDIAVNTHKAWEVVSQAFKLGFTACGMSQKGLMNTRFIHLDTGRAEDGLPRPAENDETTKVFYTY